MTRLTVPLSFRPVLKQTIWGGRRLGAQLGKPIGEDSNYAESWEVVDHGVDQSVVAGGEFDGATLQELVQSHSTDLFGGHHADEAVPHRSFPLLLKYLDCNRVLSVQVHPDDEYGATMTVPDLGKTEAWYIVDSDPGALIYAGLKTGVDRQAFGRAMETGQTEQTLHTFHPEPGDVVFIPAGTVHALGAGLLVAEIQQASDTTFRLFDWNRVDKDGKGRPLHLEAALEVTDYHSGPVSPLRSDDTKSGWQPLVQCDKFELDVIRRGTAAIGDGSGFEILTIPSGQATLRWEDCEQVLKAGDSVLMPAAMPSGQLELAAQSELAPAVLRARLPSANAELTG